MGRGSLLVPNPEGYIMESLKSESENTNQDLPSTKVSTSDQKVKTQIDRVTLNKDESEKLNRWLVQIKESSKGFLDLTRSDLVNYLIQSHDDALSTKEIKRIRQANYSLIKHLNWITPQLKKALEDNNQELVFTLQAELRGLELGVIKNAESKIRSEKICEINTSQRQRGRKSRTKSSEDKNEDIKG